MKLVNNHKDHELAYQEWKASCNDANICCWIRHKINSRIITTEALENWQNVQQLMNANIVTDSLTSDAKQIFFSYLKIKQ